MKRSARICAVLAAAAVAVSVVAAVPAKAQSPSDVAVVIANAESLSDIGTAASLVAAGAGDVVLLAESPAALGEWAAAVVSEYQPSRALLVGGVAVLSSRIEGELGGLVAGIGLERFAGSDRAHTAALAAERVLEGRDRIAVAVANGWSLPDVGTAASAVASGAADAVLYTARAGLGDATTAALRAHAPRSVTIVGGPAAVSPAAAREIAAAVPAAEVERSGGATRAHTAALLAMPAVDSGAVRAVIANGWSLLDVGIAAAHAAAAHNSVVLYAERSALGAAAEEALTAGAVSEAVMIGSPTALPYQRQHRVAELLPGAAVGRITGATHAEAAARSARHALDGTGPFLDPALTAASQAATDAVDDIGDPWSGDLVAEWTADTFAWLTGDGAAAVEIVVLSAPLWNDDPDCVAIAASLRSAATPAEARTAALGTPDELTAEILAAAIATVIRALTACDPAADEHAQGAWHWALAYRRLAEIGVTP